MRRIAIVTGYGLSTGGTEKYLQTISCLLSKNDYFVDFYYIDSDKSKISNVKINMLKDNGVNLIPYQCDSVIIKRRYIKQKESNFFNKFEGADVIINGSCGYPEEPFTFIRKIPIIQTIHYVSGIDNQYNIARTLHISEFSKNLWLKKGGDRMRIDMISHPILIPQFKKIDVRSKFNLSKDCFIFGMHQRDNDYIFSDIPLKAYKEIENEKTAFIMCGGSCKYREQAKKLQLKNAFFIESTDDNNIIYSFLNALNVYTHGRFDGELNSTALAEAMFFGLPIITHPSEKFNGHLEVVKNNGFVANDSYEYSNYMKMLMQDKKTLDKCSSESLKIFEEKYNPETQIKNLIRIINDVLENPYPQKTRRILLDFGNRISNSIKRKLIIIEDRL